MVKWLWVPIFIGMMAFFQIDPAEDPHIIFRYAENLAEGKGIVFNDTPVEGATEFLWMIILSGFHLLGFNLPAMSQVLNGLLALGILYVLHKRNAHPVIMAFSPIVIWVLSGFGTPLFALLALLMFTSAIDKKHNATVIFGLLLGLARPEGLFLFAGVAIVNRIPIKYFSWFIIGAIYYLWRLDYFGYPFPNTFYVKHAGKFFHAEGIKATVILFVTVAFLFPKRNKLLIPLLVFPFLYLITDQSQNIGMRFQFSILPSILLFVPQRKWSYLAVLPMLFIYMVSGRGNLENREKGNGDSD